MSERRTGPDMFDFVVVTVVLMAAIFIVALGARIQIRDLQRRVGQLEQQVRR